MSEWYDSQRKPSSNFRKLLQKRMDKANPRRTLTTEEQIQYQKSLLTTFEMPRIIAEGNYIDGKKEGTWTYWNREGQIQKEEVYEDGVLIKK